jgi:hypothetical protein
MGRNRHLRVRRAPSRHGGPQPCLDGWERLSGVRGREASVPPMPTTARIAPSASKVAPSTRGPTGKISNAPAAASTSESRRAGRNRSDPRASPRASARRSSGWRADSPWQAEWSAGRYAASRSGPDGVGNGWATGSSHRVWALLMFGRRVRRGHGRCHTWDGGGRPPRRCGRKPQASMSPRRMA